MKLEYHILLSTFAFSFNLRCYTQATFTAVIDTLVAAVLAYPPPALAPAPAPAKTSEAPGGDSAMSAGGDSDAMDATETAPEVRRYRLTPSNRR